MQMKDLSTLVVLVGSVLVHAGCTSKSEQSDAAPAATVETPAAEGGAPEAEEASGNIVVLLANDSMQFNTKEIRVKGGEKVTLNLVHTGRMPKASMGHNFVLLKKGVDMPAFANKALAAVDTDYIPEGDEVIAHTNVIGGGESTSVTFDAPEPGTYQFLCTFPGHFAVMNGTFIVE